MKRFHYFVTGAGLVLAAGLLLASLETVAALGSSNPNQSGSTGLEGTIASPPPKTAATIVVPVSGRTFTATPITVSGLCTSGLLVKVFSNSIFVGSAQCTNGSFSLQVDLFSGQNDLVARVYDALDQAGPDSNTSTVTFQDGQTAAFGQRVSLSSPYAKLGADRGTTFSWPIILSGGSGPYAISVDWGDGTAADLKSVAFAGEFDITHAYQNAGVYRVIVKATDASGQTAFLQLVGVGNGTVGQSTTGSGSTTGTSSGGCSGTKQFIWWPFAIIFPLMGLAFWLGKRYELQAIHRQLDRQSEVYDREA